MQVVHDKAASEAKVEREFAMIIDPANNSVLAESFEDLARHPLKHAVIRCIDILGERRVTEDANRDGPKRKKRRIEDQQQEYLCNGYDLYTNFEPCTM